VSVVVAAAVFVVSHRVPATYQSTADFRVTVPNQQGVNDSVVTAANDIASQYAQLTSAAPVLAGAAATLRVPVATLSGEISGGTVNAENLVQVTASGASPAVAQSRAQAIVVAMVNYIDSIDAQQASMYSANAAKLLPSLDQELAGLTKMLSGASASAKATHSGAVATLLEQRQQLLDTLATSAAAGEPTLQIVSTGTGASQVTPRPSLYALIAFVVALLIATRVGYLVDRRRSLGAVAARSHGS
jgi:capsular polysaccharide biosynthesis protein